jgi:hypothetical protein
MVANTWRPDSRTKPGGSASAAIDLRHEFPVAARAAASSSVRSSSWIGFPAAQLEYYERGNAVGFSYIKTAVVDGITVPCAPRYAMTAQYGCDSVTFRNNRIGYTGTPEEILLGGHAVLNVTGGLYDDATGKEFPGWLRPRCRSRTT